MAKSALDEYASKRTFTATPEPAAKLAAGREGPLLFVVQQHHASRMHYDLRLEIDGVLRSWAVPRGLSLDRSEKRLAMQTEDHPFDYASFEGVIPAGQYGAGEMIVWDCGVYSPDEGGPTYFHDRARAEAEVRAGLAAGKLGFELRGEKLKGSFALVKTKEKDQWLIIKHKDRFVSTVDITRSDRSVLSGATVEDIKVVPAHPMAVSMLVPNGKLTKAPPKLEPMLAETAEKPFNKPGWMWEPKLDGYRVLATITAEGVTLRSRRGQDYTEKYSGLLDELAKQGAPLTILDGEVVAFDANGRPSFNALQNAGPNTPMAFCAFDMLWFAGVDLRSHAYRERRRYLAQCLMPSPRVQLVHTSQDGIALHEAALASGFEGVMGKRADSKYESGKRSNTWIKVKPVQGAEFVIGGYSVSKKQPKMLASILVGYWEGPKLKYASHVGSGFDERGLKDMKARLDAISRDKMPFDEKPELNRPTVWVEPRHVVEVNYANWTDDGRLRAPVFLRLREDVSAKSVKRLDSRVRGNDKASSGNDKASGGNDNHDILAQLDSPKKDLTLAIGPHRIKLTHLDKPYWPANPALQQPAVTKRDLLKYFAQVGEYMLPHLADRPLTMIRMPDGIGGQRFFQKHWEQAKPDFVDTIRVFSSHKDENHEYLVCNNLPTLLWLAQSGTLEFHVWHSRAKPGADSPVTATDYDTSEESLEESILNFPDYVLFDIDPYIYSGKEAKGAEPELNTVAFEKGKEVAFHVRELLNTMKLDPIVKTSGKTGLHVFVPIKREIDFDAARHVSELVGRHLVKLHPKDVTVEWSVPKRTGKIFMDYNMNVRGKTLNVAYSPRGEAGAPVSMPLTWEELANAHPLDFRITNAPERLAEIGDRWARALVDKQDLGGALKKV